MAVAGKPCVGYRYVWNNIITLARVLYNYYYTVSVYITRLSFACVYCIVIIAGNATTLQFMAHNVFMCMYGVGVVG